MSSHLDLDFLSRLTCFHLFRLISLICFDRLLILEIAVVDLLKTGKAILEIEIEFQVEWQAEEKMESLECLP